MSDTSTSATIEGTPDDDVLLGTSEDDILRGFAGDDVLRGGAGNDSLFGGDGQDDITTGENATLTPERDEVNGGDGDDRIDVSRSTEDGIIAGDAGNDVIRVQGAFRGVLDGGSGTDTLEFSGGNTDIAGATLRGFERTNAQNVLVDLDREALGALGDLSVSGSVTFRLATAGEAAFDGLTIAPSGVLQIAASDGGTTLVSPESVALGAGARLRFEGGDGADEATGFDGDDALFGGGGDDLLDGGAGDDEIDGGIGSDTLIGGDGNDTIRTGPNGGVFADIDLVLAGDGDDVIEKAATTIAGELRGEAGNDIIVLRRDFAGLLDGGADFDTLSFAPGTANVSGSVISGIERTEITGTNLTIDAEDVNDLGQIALSRAVSITLSSAGKADFVPVSGDATATLTVNAHEAGSTVRFDPSSTLSSYIFEGSDGSDDAIGQSGDDVLSGGGGADMLAGRAGDDILRGGTGDDILEGGAGNDTLEGGTAGRDLLSGGAGADTFVIESDATITDLTAEDVIRLPSTASFGNVTILRNGSDALLEVDGFGIGRIDFTIRVQNAGGLEFIVEVEDFRLVVRAVESGDLIGTPGDDELVGTPDADIIDGLAGDDLILGLDDADILTGGEGDDTIDGGPGEDTISGGDGADVLRTGQTITPGAKDADLLDGGTGDDQLTVERGSGRATLLGGAGDDTFRLESVLPFTGRIDGGAGIDSLDLTAGPADLASADLSGLESSLLGSAPVTLRPDQVTELGALRLDGPTAAINLVSGGVARFVVVTLETGQQLFLTGSGEDTKVSFADPAAMEGSIFFQTRGGDNEVEGGAGDDVLYGAGGADRLSGGTGADTVGGGDGNDIIEGGAGDDTLSGEDGDDIVDGGAGNDLIFLGIGNDTITDLEGDTSVFALDTGFSGAKTIRTGDGDDTVSLVTRFGDGTGRIETGGGADRIWGGAHGDRIDAGTGDDLIVGGIGDDVLLGGAGDDRIHGGDGDDTLDGGAGNDILFGGAGDDVFRSGGGFDIVFGGGGASDVEFDPVLGGIFFGGSEATIERSVLDRYRAAGIDLSDLEDFLTVIDSTPAPNSPSNSLRIAAVAPADEERIDGIQLSLNGFDLTSENYNIIIRDENGKNFVAVYEFDPDVADVTAQITGTDADEIMQIYTTGDQIIDGGGGDDELLGSPFDTLKVYRGGEGDDAYRVETFLDADFIFEDYEPNETVVIEDGALVTTLPDDGNGPRFQVTDRSGHVATLRFGTDVDPADVFFQEKSDYERVQKITNPDPDPTPPPDLGDPTPPPPPDDDDDGLGGGGATPPPPPSGPEADMFGQPGIVTLDGAYYDFQGVGEFTLLRGTDTARPLEVQVRTEAMGDAVSAITAIAVTVGGQRVTIDAAADTLLRIDGVETPLSSGRPILLDDGARIYSDSGKILIVLADGEQIMVGLGDGRLDICVFLDNFRAGLVEGLMGNADGDPANDLAFPAAAGGAVLVQPVDFGTLYGDFADAWRVTDASSLFDYVPGLGSEDYQDRSFPPVAISIDVLPDAVVAMATAVVDAAGITDPILRDAAILDVALTGDASYAATARNLAADPQTVIATDPASRPDAPEMIGVGTLATEIVENTGSAPTEAEFILYRIGDATEALSVAWRVLESGVDAADFAAGVLPSGEATFLPGQTELRLTLTLVSDAIAEADESLTLEIDAPDFVQEIGRTVTVSVRDDDPDGVFSLAGTGADNTVEIASDEGDLRVTAGELAGQSETGVSLVQGSAQSDRILADDLATWALTVTAAAGDDVIQSGGGNDDLDGGAGDDQISGGSGDDIISGGSGDDQLNGDAGRDTLQGGSGSDRLNGGAGDDGLFGGQGFDILLGGDGNDTAEGEAGDDRIEAGAGDDALDGGAGNDWLQGDAGEDLLDGGLGDDTLSGGAGDDRLRGGSGDDVIDGGEGIDTAVFAGASSAYLITRSAETGGVEVRHHIPLGENDDGVDMLTGIERLEFADGAFNLSDLPVRAAPQALTEASDRFVGTRADDTIEGLSGRDRLLGRDGEDALFGGAGSDLIHGGDGDDLIDGGAATDILFGGAGADMFRFGDFGRYDVVRDFELGVDRLQLIGGHFIASDGSVSSDDLRLVETGRGTLLQGTLGAEGAFRTIVSLNGVQGADLSDLLDNPIDADDWQVA